LYIGHRLVVFSACLHYSLGNTINQIIVVLNHHLSISLSGGGLSQNWFRLGTVLEPCYNEIHTDCLTSGVLYADESGWRVNGQTHWVWCFTTKNATYFNIGDNRGQEALNEFFKEFYNGVLVSDFWAAYNSVQYPRMQKCMVHLLREFKKVEQYKATFGN